MANTGVGLRLDEEAIKTLKVTAVERGTSLSALVGEALREWWKTQPESKTKGPLFPKEKEPKPKPEKKGMKKRG